MSKDWRTEAEGLSRLCWVSEAQAHTACGVCTVFAEAIGETTWLTSRLLPDKTMISIPSRIMSPTKGYVQALTPIPVNVTLSGIVFAGITKFKLD